MNNIDTSVLIANLNTTALNTPTGQVSLGLSWFTSGVSLIVTFLGLIAFYLLIGQFSAGVIISGLKMKGMKGAEKMKTMFGIEAQDGVMAYISANITNTAIFLVVLVLIISGQIFPLTGKAATALTDLTMKAFQTDVTNLDTPGAIKSFKDNIAAYPASQLTATYEKELQSAYTIGRDLLTQIQNGQVSNEDSKFKAAKNKYTAHIAKAEIISQQLAKTNYATENGLDASTFNRHKVQGDVSNQESGALFSSFLDQATLSKFGVSISATN